jgi:hypothetical protein
MITGSGQVSLLSGQIQCYRVGLLALHRCTPTVRWAAAPAGWAAREEEAGWAEPVLAQ